MSTPAPIRETAPNLFQRINLVMRDVGTMPKTGQNQSQNYKFIEQALMMAVLRPLCVEHGIVILPEILGTEWHRPEGAKQTTARCQMRFTLINADNPAEKAECLWSSEGADMGDKGVNKAGTSGEKYFLMKLFMLSDKDEPDAEAVPEMPRPSAQKEPTPIRPMPSVPACRLHSALGIELGTYLTNHKIDATALPDDGSDAAAYTALLNKWIVTITGIEDKGATDAVVKPAVGGPIHKVFDTYRAAGVGLKLPTSLHKAGATWLLATLEKTLTDENAANGTGGN